MSKFIIEIRTKGFGSAKHEMDKMTKSTKDYVKEADRQRGSTKGLQGSIGSLRNQILVYTFAIGGAVAAMSKFVKAASGFEDVKTRLVGLTGSVAAAERAFKAFNQVAATTPFMLDDVVNAGAQLEAFGLEAEATLMATTDLAAYMGTTAVEAASALGRAFAGGVGAADMLRDKGIRQLIQDFHGIEDITKLTLPEFRVALISAMADPAAGIAGSSARMSKTFTGAVSNMMDAVTRFNAKVGEAMLPSLKKTVNATEDFFRTLEIRDLKRWALSLGAVATAYGVVTTAAGFATGATLAFSRAVVTLMTTLRRLGIAALVVGFNYFVQWVLTLNDATDDLAGKQLKYNKAVEEARKKLDAYIAKLDLQAAVIAEVNEKIMAGIRAQAKRNEDLAVEIYTLGEVDLVTKALIESRIRGTRVSQLELELLQQLQDKQEALAVLEKARASEKERLASIMRKEKNNLIALARIKAEEIMILEKASLLKAKREGRMTAAEVAADIEIYQNKMDAIAAISDAIQTENSLYPDLLDSYDAATTWNELFALEVENGTASLMKRINAIIQLHRSREMLIGTELYIFKQEQDANEKKKEAAERAADAVKAQREAAQKSEAANRQLASSIMLVAGSLKSLTEAGITQEQQWAIMMQTMGSIMMMFPGGQIPGAMLSAGSMFVGHTGGLVKDDGIQRFAQGGMVRGQDNVPIMAQAGEFIMQRNAVQNIGVQNLAEMNRGGQGGVTVNIQGNMIGNDEFVRDNLIPQIQKAAKQNLA